MSFENVEIRHAVCVPQRQNDNVAGVFVTTKGLHSFGEDEINVHGLFSFGESKIRHSFLVNTGPSPIP